MYNFITSDVNRVCDGLAACPLEPMCSLLLSYVWSRSCRTDRWIVVSIHPWMVYRTAGNGVLKVIKVIKSLPKVTQTKLLKVITQSSKSHLHKASFASSVTMIFQDQDTLIIPKGELGDLKQNQNC